MTPPCIAFLPIVRVQFDLELAEEVIRSARARLQASGFELVGPKGALRDLTEAQAAARELSSIPVDLLLVFQATFADSTMVLALTEAVDAPVFLWAVPEAWTGGRLRLNSLCGINLAAHALTLHRRRYDYAYAPPEDEAIMAQIKALAAAGALRRKLKAARVGVVGEPPEGMDSCRFDESALQSRFGIRIRRIPLEEAFSRARAVPEGPLAETRAALDGRLEDLASLEQAPLTGTLRVYHALREIADEEHLDGLAVRCWPEFFTQMGCAACGAMSLLSDGLGMAQPVPCGCEVDVHGTITQLILQWLSGSPAFGTDIVGANKETDRVALWHCGLAPLSMADPAVQPKGGIHSNRKVPLVMDFPLKEGEVTLARLSQAAGGLRLVYGHGRMMAEPKPFSGTAGILKLDGRAGDFLDRLMRQGLEHHLSLTYGNYVRELRAFAGLMDLPTLDIGKGEME